MDAVEDIKGRLNIEDVIGRYVVLKRTGRNFKGLSPFSAEKTPSFVVSPEKQIWHDFSSGKGGNMFSFVMEMEGLEFKEALELLARQAGIDLAAYRTEGSRQGGQDKERIYDALELAAKFYQVHFSKSKTALEYILGKRKFTKQTALTFRIGYSPNGDNALITFMKGKGFNERELAAAGLTSKGYSGPRDMFRGRIMIPLADAQGRIIGFTARILEDDPKAPKYINTPQTAVYDKSRHVFGLHLAKEAIRTGKYSVVVEGNLDVIASHQADVKQVVATAGTAMTEMHLKALGRFGQDVRLAFDQDGAGIAATERAIPIAARTNVSLSIIDIPGGKDPDELIQKDPAAWTKAIESNKYALDWLVEQYQKRLDLTTAPGKKQFSDILLKVVRSLTDSVEQDHYLGEIAKLISVSVDALRSKLSETPSDARQPALKKTNISNVKPDLAMVERVKSQNQLLAIMLMNPETRKLASPITAEMLPEERGQKLLHYIQKHLDMSFKQDRAGVNAHSGEYVDILVLLYEELYSNLEITELRYEAARLQVRLIEYYVKTKKIPLATAMRDANSDQMDALLKQVKELDKLLRTVKENIDGR
jgi:DNA primase